MGNIVYLGSATPSSGSGGGGGNAVWGGITGTLSNQTDLQTALNGKQNTLTAGSGISIVGDVISATGGGSVSYDGTTINENSSNELQTIAVKNASTSDSRAIPVWNGSELEYNTGETIPFYAWEKHVESFEETQVSQYNVSYNCIAVDDNGLCVMPSAGGSLFQWSEGGGSWIPDYSIPESGCADDIVFGDGEFVAVGSNGCVHCPSNDLTAWDSTLDIAGGTDFRIAYFEPSGVPTFVCVNRQGRIYVSTNKGVTWSDPTNFPTVDWLDNDQYVADIAAHGDNLVIIKMNGMVYETTDLSSWTATDLSQQGYEGQWPNTFTAIEYIPWGAGYFLAVTAYGNMAHNKNGYWTFYQPLDSSSYDFKKIASGGDSGAMDEETGDVIPNIWILSSNGKVVKYSPASDEWVELPQLSTSHSPWTSIVWHELNSWFIAAGSDYVAVSGWSSVYWYTTSYPPQAGDYMYSQPSGSAIITDYQYRVQSYDSGDDAVILNNGNALYYNSDYNTTGTASVADLHPEYLCFIDGVGVKRNDQFVATNSTPGDGTINIYQNGNVVGSFTTNQANNDDIYLESSAPDGETITYNEYDQLQTFGIKDQNNEEQSLKLWKGYNEQWDNVSGFYGWATGDWKLVNSATNTRGMIHGGDGFYVLPYGNRIAWSDLGVAFNPININFVNDVAAIGYSRVRKYCAVGIDMDCAYSNDGKNWTYQQSMFQTPFGQGYLIQYQKMVYTNTCGYCVLVSDYLSMNPTYLATSLDGRNWNTYQTPLVGNGILVSLGSDLIIIGNSSSYKANVADLSTWSTYQYGGGQCQAACVGSGTIVAVGNNSSVFTSVDGENWTAHNYGTGDLPSDSLNLVDVIYDTYSSKFIAVSSSGVGASVIRSADGASWSAFGDLYGMQGRNIVTDDGGNYILYGYNETAFKSHDGSSCWTLAETPSEGENVLWRPDEYATEPLETIDVIESGFTEAMKLSNGSVYIRDSSMDVINSVGDLHRDYIGFVIEGGVKMGDGVIATYNVIDQTYDGTSANAQSGVAIAGVLGDIETLLSQV